MTSRAHTLFLDYSVWLFRVGMKLVSGLCKSNFRVSLQAFKPGIMHITSCRNIISI